jgi:hypothetical protein
LELGNRGLNLESKEEKRRRRKEEEAGIKGIRVKNLGPLIL